MIVCCLKGDFSLKIVYVLWFPVEISVLFNLFVYLDLKSWHVDAQDKVIMLFLCYA